MSDLYRVAATELNLRSARVVKPETRKASLPRGHIVRRIEGSDADDWWHVTTTLAGTEVDGFVRSSFLEPEDGTAVASATRIEAVHLMPSRTIQRDRTSGRAFPLNEPGQPNGNSATPDLPAIIDWLKVDQSARYRPAGGATYCNIYAYDYCFLSGAYLPRVWWKGSALAQLAAGRDVPVRYGETVSELNANSLCDWLEEHGPGFNWRRTFDLDDLQSSANSGQVAVIVAKRADTNRSGHIVAVAPESSDRRAIRRDGTVAVPLQSQAGVVNFQYSSETGQWWQRQEHGRPKYSRFGFWIRR